MPGVDIVKKNAVRLAEVWLDDYKQIYYQRIGNRLVIVSFKYLYDNYLILFYMFYQ